MQKTKTNKELLRTNLRMCNKRAKIFDSIVYTLYDINFKTKNLLFFLIEESEIVGKTSVAIIQLSNSFDKKRKNKVLPTALHSPFI